MKFKTERAHSCSRVKKHKSIKKIQKLEIIKNCTREQECARSEKRMETENQQISLKAQSTWLLFAKVVGFGFTFLLPPLTVRYLSQDKVGTYRQIFQMVGNLTIVLSLGVSMSAYYFLSRDRAKRGAAMANIVIFNFTMGALAFLTLFFFPQLAGNVFQNPEITRLAPQIGLVIWIWLFSGYLETVAIANGEAKMATAFIILAQLTKTLLMVGAVVIFTTVEAFLYAAMLQSAIQTLVLLWYLNSRFPRFWAAFSWQFFREHLFYALPFGLSGILWILQTDIHNYFVGYRFTQAEYAIYAYGCFELPLIGSISDSVTSVMFTRISHLQSVGDKPEMLRLTIRAMQKLAFFYFPLYIFFLITAQVFVVTLFTGNYLASVPIFLINITLLPFYIWTIDPIVRAYKELGRFLLIERVALFAAMTAALYYGIQNFDLRGMIAIVVATVLIEKVILTWLVIKKLECGWSDFALLKGIGSTAICALIAGIPTFLFYYFARQPLTRFGVELTQKLLATEKTSILDFTSGVLVLGLTFMLMSGVYLLAANYFGIIDSDEKELARKLFDRIFRRNRNLPLETTAF